MKAYIKLSGAPVKINVAANPFNSKDGFLPYLVEDNKTYNGYDKIINHLKSAMVNIFIIKLDVLFNF